MSNCPSPQEMYNNLNNIKEQESNQENQNEYNQQASEQINNQNEENSNKEQKSSHVFDKISSFLKKFSERPPSYLIKMSQTYFKFTFQDKKQLLEDKKKQKEQEKKKQKEEEKQKQKETQNCNKNKPFEQKQKKIYINKLNSDSQIEGQKDREKILFQNQKINQFQSLTHLSYKTEAQNSQPKPPLQLLKVNVVSKNKENNAINGDCSIKNHHYNNNNSNSVDNKCETLNNQSSLNTNHNDLSKVDKPKNKQNEVACVICFENTPNSVFMNCGHGGICKPCAIDISIKTGVCFLCREQIKQIVRVKDTQSDKKYQEVASVIYIDTTGDIK